MHVLYLPVAHLEVKSRHSNLLDIETHLCPIKLSYVTQHEERDIKEKGSRWCPFPSLPRRLLRKFIKPKEKMQKNNFQVIGDITSLVTLNALTTRVHKVQWSSMLTCSTCSTWHATSLLVDWFFCLQLHHSQLHQPAPLLSLTKEEKFLDQN